MNFVFDFSRVLFRWRPEVLLREVLPGRAADEASARHWVDQIFQSYGGDWAEFDRGTVSPQALAQRIATRTGLRLDEAQAVIEAVPGELQPLPDSVALLQRVRAAGRRTFYLSNMPAPYADQLEAAHDFVRGFDAGVFSARVGFNKPEPEIFALAAARFGVPAETLLFLDDHAPNVQAARQAGWQALLFTDAAQAERDLRAAGWWLD
ncbi:HAD family hydrolase [Aquabacterium sp. OR-4]|uniref:HAD family hydrolase n=1 Tax=Aquabacterium sp. OR-4 TaxID=2978127 RepID=UPI0028C709D4|nr:HAD family phosphatase [Aquabacterium sp. OR-4]MDT7837551.1 HAD family phosphatase [Aquabacterium sp. OR-4]